MGACCSKSANANEHSLKENEKIEAELGLPKFDGDVFERGHKDYGKHRYQYATSSYPEDVMSPLAIVYCKNDNDIIKAIEYAKSKNIAVAVRTGGHHYSGMSSTSGNNIQLDLSKTFRNDDQDFKYDAEKNLLYVGVSYDLGTFGDKCAKLGISVPHGQCSHVHIGGHVQTGGYGQLARSFGLFGDTVVSFRIILVGNKEAITVTRESHPDLFYAVLGGSPGNFGVLTHVTCSPYLDKDHPKSRGFLALYWYNTAHLRKLLEVMAEASDDDNFPGDFDYCVSASSANLGVFQHFSSLDEKMKERHPKLFGPEPMKGWPPVIFVMIQWANLGGESQEYDPSFFQKVKDLSPEESSIIAIPIKDDKTRPLSHLVKHWAVMQNPREYDIPYVKRVYSSNATNLTELGWAKWAAHRASEIEGTLFTEHGCKLAAQSQLYGGKNSSFYTKRNNGTSYAWRDARIVSEMDAFYTKDHKKDALAWVATNDKEAHSPNGYLFNQDRRLFWGSYGNLNMNIVWPSYYESREQYAKICATKAKFDPTGVFSPNEFGANPNGPTPIFPTFDGDVFYRGEGEVYEDHRYQYATSSNPAASLSPSVIIYAKNDSDVIKAINYCRERKIALAVRTGGHQYCGMSSTSGENLQLDLSTTYKNEEDFKYDPATSTLRTSISFKLGTFNKKLGENKVFVPHGQCAHVHVGGHCQTGGYGMIGRAFGLFGDHIRAIEIFTADGNKKIVTKASDPEFFFAILGGSPGNYGVITHLTIEVHKNEDHPNARGVMKMYWLNEKHLQKLFEIMVEAINDDDYAGDYDFCVSVMSPFIGFLDHYPSLDEYMREKHPHIFGKDILSWPPMILLTAQWSNLGGAGQDYDPAFFKKIKDAGNEFETIWTFVDDDKPTPISDLTHLWVTLPNPREFNLPFEKRTYLTKETKRLIDKNFAHWAVKRLHDTQGPFFSNNGNKLVSQFQHYGGKHSRYWLNRDNGTSYSWRDGGLFFAMDNFYEEKNKKVALEWVDKNDKEGVGPDGVFSVDDRRVLYGSFGNTNMADVWQYYYDSKEKYDRLCKIKEKVDPTKVFTPNGFSVQNLK